MLLKVQKLDRRMTGHRYFKYRVEFPVCAVRGVQINDMTVYGVKILLFTEIMQHLCSSLGFGPYVDYTQYAKDAKWAFRIADHNHIDTIYLTEEALEEYNKFMTFARIKYSG